MGIFEMVVAIVAILMVGRLVHARIKSPSSDAPTAGTPDQLRRLEQRIQALETIVSDQGYDLKQKFSELENR